MIDKRLLERIIKTPSISTNEWQMVSLVCDELDTMGIKYELDEIGNIYSFKKDTILLSAHMDTVGSEIAQLRLPMATFSDSHIIGADNIGADDKNGVYLILNALKTFKDISFCFSVQEEIGALGAYKVVQENEDIIKDCSYFIVLDRKGSSDLICNNNDYGTKKFEKFLLNKIKKFGFKKSTGSFSDADEFNKSISGANISVGYYNPHTDDEYIDVKILMNTQKALDYILKNHKKGDKFCKPKKYNKWDNWEENKTDWVNDFYNDVDDIDEEISEDFGNSFNDNDWRESAEEEGLDWENMTEDEKIQYKTDCFRNYYEVK